MPTPKTKMRTFNIHEAKTHLSRLVDEAERGEPFIIAKAGKPKVKVMRLDASVRPTKRRLGGLEGIYSVPEDFEEIDKQLDKEVEKLMFGEDEE
jgi:prevent-host-death family protein